MKDNRPVNLDIGSIQLPLTAIASILHRISGVFLVAGVAVLLCLLDASLASESSFNEIKQLMGSFTVKLVVWIVLSALIYHTAAGVKHLIMDLGYGETMQGGITGAKIVFAAFIILTVLAGALIW